ncbi:hypothetical protein ADL12_32405 [Streptomyces regalis]|uniref:Uncharacterized protein n=2 Tax=Streptomyces regalis TaxID=68262 RepID=A0A101JH19_9ACTN|nr:hypothetical protein ADL12_32405 [Streptomyces regalis]
MWALVGFSLDSAGGTAYMAPVLLGKELTGQLPYGHYQILVLFLAQKLNPDHHPRLLGMAEGFEAIMPGDVKLRIVGRWATYANTERLRSLPGVGGTPDHIAFTAPSVDRARHE